MKNDTTYLKINKNSSIVIVIVMKNTLILKTKLTPWKINDWNLQSSPIKRKEHNLSTKPPQNYVPAINL